MHANSNRGAIANRSPSRVRSWPALAWLLVSVICFVALTDSLNAPTLIDFDTRLAMSIKAWRGSRLDQLMLSLTAFGGWSMTVIALTTTLGLWAADHRREAILTLIVTAGVMLLNLLLKFLIDRPRPDVALIYLISGTRFASFPSGHTMGALATLGSLMVVAQRMGAPVWAQWLGWLLSGLLIAGIAISRVYLGAHFPSDVLGGLLVSSAWLLIVAGSLERDSQAEDRSD
jgi:undecaprenyl-diphosphatase